MTILERKERQTTKINNNFFCGKGGPKYHFKLIYCIFFYSIYLFSCK